MGGRWCLQAESKVNSNVFANNFYSLWTVPVFPSYPSLQHVIGHKKLQLCINLLHWSLEGSGRRRRRSKYRMESNRIEWKRSQAKDGGLRDGGEWRTDGEDKHRHGALITTCHQILMSNPLARTVRTSPRVAPPRHKAQQHLISVVNDANIIICSCDFWKRKLVIFSK